MATDAKTTASVKSLFANGKKLFEMVNQQKPYFAEVTPLLQDAITIVVTARITGAEADIHSVTDGETVKTVLRTLRLC